MDISAAFHAKSVDYECRFSQGLSARVDDRGRVQESAR
jgi:hypothetical protein